jgi:flagellar hook-length control protein FliK
MVREAVEAALPRLRDMLGAQGIVLADVNVSHQHSSHGQSDSGGDGSTPGTAARQREPDVETTAPVRRTVAAGILDVYA